MTFVTKQNAVKSARSWGVLGLLLALAVGIGYSSYLQEPALALSNHWASGQNLHDLAGSTNPAHLAAGNLVPNPAGGLFFQAVNGQILLFWPTGNAFNLDPLGQQPAPAAVVTVPGDLVLHPSGNDLFFRGAAATVGDGRIYRFTWANGKWTLYDLHALAGAPPSATGIDPGNLVLQTGVQPWQLFFRGTNGRIQTFWWSGSTLKLNELNPTQPLAAAGDLVLHPSGNELFFRGTNGRIYSLWWFNRQWLTYDLEPSTPVSAAGDLVLHPSGNALFFRGNDNKIYRLSRPASNCASWESPPQNINNLVGAPAVSAANALGNLVLHPSGNELFFRDSTGNQIYMFRLKPLTHQALLTPGITAAGNLVLHPSGNELFFRDNQGRIHRVWRTPTGGWSAPENLHASANYPPTAAGDLVLGPSGNELFFRGTDNKIHRFKR